ncbi:uncharacterized protein SEPMUDRAFT_151137, partial [Sphaerulina musiva SO2202]
DVHPYHLRQPAGAIELAERVGSDRTLLPHSPPEHTLLPPVSRRLGPRGTTTTGDRLAQRPCLSPGYLTLHRERPLFNRLRACAAWPAFSCRRSWTLG